MKELFKSAVHIILTKDNKILLQKRKGSKLWPGYYALPAGHIDSGENQYDALVREAKFAYIDTNKSDVKAIEEFDQKWNALIDWANEELSNNMSCGLERGCGQ